MSKNFYMWVWGPLCSGHMIGMCSELCSLNTVLKAIFAYSMA